MSASSNVGMMNFGHKVPHMFENYPREYLDTSNYLNFLLWKQNHSYSFDVAERVKYLGVAVYKFI